MWDLVFKKTKQNKNQTNQSTKQITAFLPPKSLQTDLLLVLLICWLMSQFQLCMFLHAQRKSLYKLMLTTGTRKLIQLFFFHFFKMLGNILLPNFSFSLLFCWSGGSTGVWTQGLMFAMQVLYCLSHSTSLSPNFGSMIYMAISNLLLDEATPLFYCTKCLSTVLGVRIWILRQSPFNLRKAGYFHFHLQQSFTPIPEGRKKKKSSSNLITRKNLQMSQTLREP
jgi:hypothetical protein